MNIKELRQMSEKKLSEALAKARRDLSVSRFHVATGKNQNTSQIRSFRKIIAQILTLQKESSLNDNK